MNLLVGLTVSKIEEQMKTGEKIQASKRVEDLFGLTSILEWAQPNKYSICTFCLSWMPVPIMKQLEQKKVF